MEMNWKRATNKPTIENPTRTDNDESEESHSPRTNGVLGVFLLYIMHVIKERKSTLTTFSRLIEFSLKLLFLLVIVLDSYTIKTPKLHPTGMLN